MPLSSSPPGITEHIAQGDPPCICKSGVIFYSRRSGQQDAVMPSPTELHLEHLQSILTSFFGAYVSSCNKKYCFLVSLMWEDAHESPVLEPLLWAIKFGVRVWGTTKPLLDTLVEKPLWDKQMDTNCQAETWRTPPLEGTSEGPLSPSPTLCQVATMTDQAVQWLPLMAEATDRRLTAMCNAQLNAVRETETAKCQAACQPEFSPFPGKILKNRFQYDMCQFLQ